MEISPDMAARGDKEFKDFTAQQLRDLSDRMQTIEVALEQNTIITKNIAEIMAMGKGFFRTCNMIGRGVIWFGGLVAGCTAFWHFAEASVKGWFK